MSDGEEQGRAGTKGGAPLLLRTTLSRLEAAGGVLEFGWTRGERRRSGLLVASTEGVRAWRNVCPHWGVPLSGPGESAADPEDPALLRCGLHGARFRREDGACVEGPCVGAGLRALRVRMAGTSIDVLDAEGPQAGLRRPLRVRSAERGGAQSDEKDGE